MPVNNLPTEDAVLVGVIDPDAYAAGTYTTGWIDASKFHRFMAVVYAGDLSSSATLDAKLQLASDGSGTGAEDITGKAITQLTQAGSDSNKQSILNLRPEQMVGATKSFKDGTATHFRLSMTVATAASDAGAAVYAFDARYSPAADLASVDEVK